MQNISNRCPQARGQESFLPNLRVSTIRKLRHSFTLLHQNRIIAISALHPKYETLCRIFQVTNGRVKIDFAFNRHHVNEWYA